MKWFLSIICVLFLCSVNGQRIISSISCSEDSIEIGEEFQLHYKLTLPQNFKFQFVDFSPLDKIESLVQQDTASKPYYAELELQALFSNYKDKRLPSNLFKSYEKGSVKIITDTINAVFWDIGIFEIPHPALITSDSMALSNKMNLQSPRIMVTPPAGVMNQDTTSAILPIKDIIITKRSLKEYWPYLVALLILLLTGIGFLKYFRKQSQQETEIVTVVAPPKPAHIIALNKIEKLKTEQLWKVGRVKEYQSQLTYILREYLENRYDIPALESTTGEIVSSTKKLGVKTEHQNDITEILQIADMVKFAKAKPEEDINEKFLDRTRQFVQETKAPSSLTESLENDG